MNKGAVGKTGEKALKLHGTFRWIWINSLSSWVRFNMSTWKMERIHPLTSAVNVLILPLKRRLGRLIRGNLMRNLSRRSWTLFIFQTLLVCYFNLDSVRRFFRSATSFSKDAAKLWAKSWSMPPIGAPYVCSYFYSWHMWIFGLLWELCWLCRRPFQQMSSHLCRKVKPVELQKSSRTGEVAGENERFGVVGECVVFFLNQRQPFKR